MTTTRAKWRRETAMKPGDINEDGKEIEQDGSITWDSSLKSSEKGQETNAG